MNTKQFARYKIIDKLLRDNECVKTSRIREVVRRETGQTVTPRQIQIDLERMKNDPDLGYEAPIEKVTSKKAYRYTDRSYTIDSMGLGKSEIESLQLAVGLLETYRKHPVFQGMETLMDKLSSVLKATEGNEKGKQTYIHIDRKATTKGNEHIATILKAIKASNFIAFRYQKFGKATAFTRRITPYFLKEYDDRWYVYGNEVSENEDKTFGLERMSNLHVEEDVFEYPEIDAEEIYKNVMGVTKGGKKAEKVMLEFIPAQADYLRTLPLHNTQEIIRDDNDGFRITLEVVLNYELTAKILSYGAGVEVLEPEHLRIKIGKTLKEALKKY